MSSIDLARPGAWRASWVVATIGVLIGTSCGPERPAAERASDASRSASPDAHDDAPSIAASGPIALEASWRSCATLRDCVIVAVGCCSKVAANVAHASAARKAIADSSRPICSVKSACGRGTDGTDDGEPAECARGRCVLPIIVPDGFKTCSTDDDCVVAVLDCCNKVAVRKSFEKHAILAMQDIELDRPTCPPSMPCPDPPPVCASGACAPR